MVTDSKNSNTSSHWWVLYTACDHRACIFASSFSTYRLLPLLLLLYLLRYVRGRKRPAAGGHVSGCFPSSSSPLLLCPHTPTAFTSSSSSSYASSSFSTSSSSFTFSTSCLFSTSSYSSSTSASSYSSSSSSSSASSSSSSMVTEKCFAAWSRDFLSP